MCVTVCLSKRHKHSKRILETEGQKNNDRASTNNNNVTNALRAIAINAQHEFISTRSVHKAH